MKYLYEITVEDNIYRHEIVRETAKHYIINRMFMSGEYVAQDRLKKDNCNIALSLDEAMAIVSKRHMDVLATAKDILSREEQWFDDYSVWSNSLICKFEEKQ